MNLLVVFFSFCSYDDGGVSLSYYNTISNCWLVCSSGNLHTQPKP